MNHHDTNCLNCGKALTGNYCDNCGQSASTHRFSLKHILSHDMVHGLFHVDKGILFTIKELFTRPGHMVREYVGGKRIKQFNYITLLLVIIAAYLFVAHSLHYNIADVMGRPEIKKEADKVQAFVERNMKLQSLFTIPFNALFVYLVFRRSGKNYAETLVLETYLNCARLMIQLVFVIIASLAPHGTVGTVVSVCMALVTLPYTFWFYKQFYSPFYENRVALSFMILFAMLIPVLVMTLFAIIAMVIYGQDSMQSMLHQFGVM